MNELTNHQNPAKAIESIISGDFGIPIIYGEITHTSGTAVEMSFDAIEQYRPLLTLGSIALLDARQADDGSIASISVRIRLGYTDTWLAAHHSLLPEIEDDDTGDDAGDEGDELDFKAPSLTTEQYDLINHMAAEIACESSFSNYVMRVEPREEIAEDVVERRFSEFGELGMFTTKLRIVSEVSARSRAFWEGYVVPIRAKALKDAGSTPTQIAKALGITKQRAERAVQLASSIDRGMTAHYMLPIIRKYI